MEKKFRFTVLMVLALAVGLTAGAANAVLIAYDPFDYPADEDLLGQIGATESGWTGGWRDGITDGDPPKIVAGSPMPGGIGNHAELYSTSITGNAGDFARVLDTSLPDDGSTYWISVVFKMDNLDNYLNNWMYFGVGHAISFGKGWNTEYFGLWEDPGGVYAGTDTLVTELSTLVVKIESNIAGKEQVCLWVNPDPGAEPENGTADAGPLAIDLSGPKSYQVFNAFAWEYAVGVSGPAHCDDWLVDEIKIGTTWDDVKPIVACDKTSVPVPANDKENENPGIAQLSWDPPTPACVPSPLYDVYFGTDSTVANNPKIADDIAVTFVEPNDPLVEYSLAMGTQYYWRADVDNDPEGEGYVWNFTTWPTEPLITTQPKAAVTVPVGDPATVTVVSGGNEAGSHAYQWYYHANPGDVNSLMVGKTSSTLNLTNVQPTVTEGNEGYYVCDVNNTSGPIYSDSGRVLTPRLMAHWKFDNAGAGNYHDETGVYHAGVAHGPGGDAPAPSFVTGINGQAVKIEGDPNKFIMVDGTIGPLNDITVSMWVKPADPNDALFFAPQVGEAWDFGGTASVHIWQAYDSTYDNGAFMGQVTGAIELGEPNTLTIGEWSHIVFVYDTNDTNAVARYHINGDLVPVYGVYETLIDVSVLPNVLPASMGKRNGVGPYPFTFDQGLIDDVRVYNYALTPVEVAQLYIAPGFMPSGTPCIGPVEFDLNDDCEVDTKDVKVIVDSWLLDCQLVYPGGAADGCLDPVIPQ